MLLDDIWDGRRVVSDDALLNETHSELLARLSGATIVAGQNVVDYSQKQGFVPVGACPNIVVPVDNMFVEFRAPGTHRRCGILLSKTKANEIVGGWRTTPDLVLDDDDVKWMISAVVLHDYPDHDCVQVVGKYLALCNESGQNIGDSVGVPGRIMNHLTKGEGAITQARAEALITLLAAYALLTISFMHCKNVNIRTVEQPKKLQAARIKDGRRPLITYRVLEIEPMKKILRTEGQVNKLGLKKALHICRGHFKDYRESGLFGRNHGIYWWEQAVRGEAQHGIALKDYSVNAPTTAN